MLRKENGIEVLSYAEFIALCPDYEVEEDKIKAHGEPLFYRCESCHKPTIHYGTSKWPLCLECLCKELSEETGVQFQILEVGDIKAL